MARRHRFPHHVSRWRQLGDDGEVYACTATYYVAVLRDPQQVFMDLVIEGPNGYRTELRGDNKIRPVMERVWAAAALQVCVCGHQRSEHNRWLKAHPCGACDCQRFSKQKGTTT